MDDTEVFKSCYGASEQLGSDRCNFDSSGGFDVSLGTVTTKVSWASTWIEDEDFHVVCIETPVLFDLEVPLDTPGVVGMLGARARFAALAGLSESAWAGGDVIELHSRLIVRTDDTPETLSRLIVACVVIQLSEARPQQTALQSLLGGSPGRHQSADPDDGQALLIPSTSTHTTEGFSFTRDCESIVHTFERLGLEVDRRGEFLKVHDRRLGGVVQCLLDENPSWGEGLSVRLWIPMEWASGRLDSIALEMNQREAGLCDTARFDQLGSWCSDPSGDALVFATFVPTADLFDGLMLRLVDADLQRLGWFREFLAEVQEEAGRIRASQGERHNSGHEAEQSHEADSPSFTERFSDRLDGDTALRDDDEDESYSEDHDEVDGLTRCAACSRADSELKRVLRYRQGDAQPWPRGFAPEGASCGAVEGHFPLCAACLPACEACARPRLTPPVERLVETIRANQELRDGYLHWFVEPCTCVPTPLTPDLRGYEGFPQTLAQIPEVVATVGDDAPVESGRSRDSSPEYVEESFTPSKDDYSMDDDDYDANDEPLQDFELEDEEENDPSEGVVSKLPKGGSDTGGRGCPCGCGQRISFGRRRIAAHGADLAVTLPILEYGAKLSSLPGDVRGGIATAARDVEAFSSALLGWAHRDAWMTRAMLPSLGELAAVRNAAGHGVFIVANAAPDAMSKYLDGLSRDDRRLIQQLAATPLTE